MKKTFFGFYFPREFYASEAKQISHERLVAHKIKIFQTQNPEWKNLTKSKNSPLTAFGEQKHINTIDLGHFLLERSGVTTVEEILDKEAEFKLPDGTIIRGTQYRKIPIGQPSLDITTRYLDIEFNGKAQNPNYTFSLKNDQLSEGTALFYGIENYVVIDKKKVSSQTKIAFPVKNKTSYSFRIK